MRVIRFPIAATLAFLSAFAVANAQQPAPGTVSPSAGQQHPADAPAENVFVNGALAVPGAPTDSQTVPAKFSKRNDRLDHIGIVALPLPLDDTQKRQIAEIVLRQNAPIESINVKAPQTLNDRIELRPLPKDIAAQMPMMKGLDYIRLPGKVVFVSPANRIVVGEIATN